MCRAENVCVRTIPGTRSPSPTPARSAPAGTYCSRSRAEDQLFAEPHLEPALTGGATGACPPRPAPHGASSTRSVGGLVARGGTASRRREDPGAGGEPTEYVLGFLRYVTFPNTVFLKNLVLKIQLHIENHCDFFCLREIELKLIVFEERKKKENSTTAGPRYSFVATLRCCRNVTLAGVRWPVMKLVSLYVTLLKVAAPTTP